MQNLTDVARQSVYLVLVSLGQMLVLVTGGFDLSVGTAIVLTSVVSATVMVAVGSMVPHAVVLAILLGLLAGLGAALLVGLASGIGISIFGVSLRGGIGRVESVVLGAFFITLVQNGMDVMQVGSYMQMVLLGGLLVVAVIVDQMRYHMMLGRV